MNWCEYMFWNKEKKEKENKMNIKTRTLSFDLNTLPKTLISLKAIVLDDNGNRVERGHVIFTSKDIPFEDNVEFKNGVAVTVVDISNFVHGKYYFNVNFTDETGKYCDSNDSAILQIFEVFN